MPSLIISKESIHIRQMFVKYYTALLDIRHKLLYMAIVSAILRQLYVCFPIQIDSFLEAIASQEVTFSLSH